MKDKDKTKTQLLEELNKLRKQVTEFEKSGSGRKNAEEKQKKTEERSTISPEFLSDGYLSVDLKGKVTECNSAFLNLTGYSREDIVNKHFTKLPTLQLKDILLYIKMFNLARRGKLPESIEFKWIHNDETIHWGESHIGIIRKKRKISGINVILRDITERKKIEETLKESEKKYRELVDNSVVGVYETSLDGTLLYVNQALATIFDFNTPQDMISENALFRYKNPEDRKKLIDILRKNKKLNNYEIQAVTKTGKDIVILTNSTLLEDSFSGMVIDITEQMKAEEIRRESEAKYRILFENIADPIFIFDQKTHRFLDCNKSVLERYGYTLKELQALTPEQLHPPEELEDVEKNIDDEEDFSPHSYTHITKKGEKFQVEIHTSLLKYQGREAWISIVRDITERKRMEEELHKLASVVHYSSELVNLAFLDGKMIFLNEAGSKMLGIDPKAVKKHNIMEVIPEHLVDMVTNELLPALIKHGKWEGELQYRNIKTGGLTNVHAMCFTVKNPKTGTPKYLANVSLDITERKRVEEKLRQKDYIIESASSAIATADLDGKMTYANPAFLEMWGFDNPDEFLGKFFTNYWMVEDKLDEIMDVLQNEGKWTEENQARRKDGSLFDVQVSAAMVCDKKGNPISLMSSSVDITERKKAEEEIKRSQKELQNLAEHLQVATEQERGLIASELHDEVGQALTVLKMDIFMINNKLSKDQMEIPIELQKMENLLDDTIGKLRKIYSDLRPNLLEHFGVGEAMRQHSIDFQDQSGIKCIFYQDPEEIELDENRSIALYRILQGALNNIKWHSLATKANIRLVEKGPNLKLTIKDNGKGIEEEQIKSSDSFGLIGMRERARYLGGELKITGIPDKGTTVILGFPHQKIH